MAGPWQRAFELEDLPIGQARVFKAQGKQAAVFRLGPHELYAVDNRCPHEGYPLAQGYVKNCVLTCAWHNYKFDLRDGRCVQGEEAVRTFPVRLSEGRVELDLSDPDPKQIIPKVFASLEVGLVENAMGRVARDVVRLLQAGVSAEELLFAAARHDADRAEYGSTHALAVAADGLRYLERYPNLLASYPIMQAMDLAAEPNTRLQKRLVPKAQDAGPDPLAAGARLRELVESEDAVGAEGLLRGALAQGFERPVIEAWLFRLCADHFLDFGHALIFQIKAFDLLDRVGWARASEILPAHLFRIVAGTREDKLPAWSAFRGWLDSLDLQELYAREKPEAPGGWDLERLASQVLDDSPRQMFEAVKQNLETGAPRVAVIDAISCAAAERLLRFDPTIDQDIDVQPGWLDVTHLMTFANATRRALQRYRDPQALRLIFFAARFVNNSSPLDAPLDRRVQINPLPNVGEKECLPAILGALKSRQPERAVRLVAAHRALALPLEPLKSALCDFALKDPAVRPIVVAHYIKASIAAFEEHEALAGRVLPLAALAYFMASPISERRIVQRTHEALNFVIEGRTPRTLT